MTMPRLTAAAVLSLAVLALDAHAQRSVPANSSVPGATREAVDGPPLAHSDVEKTILPLLEQLDKNRRGTMNVPVADGRMLRILAEAIDAKTVVEIGTSNGYSGLWFCLALSRTGGRLITFDIDPGRSAMARENFQKAGVADIVTMHLGDAHELLTQKVTAPVDLVFIDADKQGYLDYLQKILPLVRPGGLILSHNMAQPRPDPEFVKAITTDPNLETHFIHMDDQGLGITLKKR